MPELKQIAPYLYEIPKTGAMRVPGRVYATRELMESQKADEAIQQVRNVAHLPGIVGYALAMGGVAAFEEEEGVISPGGVGYDINCGVRIIRTSLTRADVQPKLRELVKNLFRAIPAGVGSEGAIKAPRGDDAAAVVTQGAQWAVYHGYGTPDDLDHIE